jgi:Zn-dependent protease with chaperone function
MIPLSIALPRRTNRIVNIVVAVLFAITVAGGAVGEWGYYVLASVVEIILLAAIVVVSARWSRSAERV